MLKFLLRVMVFLVFISIGFALGATHKLLGLTHTQFLVGSFIIGFVGGCVTPLLAARLETSLKL